MKTWLGLTEKLIKKNFDKSRNTSMGHLHMRIQELQLTKEKPPDTDLKDKIKKNVEYCTTVDPSTKKEGKIYSYVCGNLPNTSRRRNKYIYVMYVYDYDAILTRAMNIRSERR